MWEVFQRSTALSTAAKNKLSLHPLNTIVHVSSNSGHDTGTFGNLTYVKFNLNLKFNSKF